MKGIYQWLWYGCGDNKIVKVFTPFEFLVDDTKTGQRFHVWIEKGRRLNNLRKRFVK